jgi:hypothetical protein
MTSRRFRPWPDLHSAPEPQDPDPLHSRTGTGAADPVRAVGAAPPHGADRPKPRRHQS